MQCAPCSFANAVARAGVALAVAGVLLADSTADAYDGPLVTPSPLVNGATSAQLAAGQSRAVVSWDIRQFAQRNFSADRRPDRVFFELKFGADFVSDTGPAPADRNQRVDSAGGLPLAGSREIDLSRSGRGPGTYFARIIAKRGGDQPNHDVARRSRSVGIAWTTAPPPGGGAGEAPSLVLEPSAAVVAPGGEVVFTAMTGLPVSMSARLLSFSVDGGDAFGTLTRPPRSLMTAVLHAPSIMPAGATQIRVVARLASTPPVTASAVAVVSGATAGPPSGGSAPPAAVQFSVASVRAPPLPVRAGDSFTVALQLRNDGTAAARIPWEVTIDGAFIGGGATDVPARQVRVTSHLVVPQNSASLGPGTHRITVQADPRNELNEAAALRGDNEKSESLVVAGTPIVVPGTPMGVDRIRVSDLRIDPDAPRLGDRVKVRFRIENLDARQPVSPLWQLFDGPNVLQTSITSLEAGATSIVSFTLSQPLAAGAHSLRVTGDPGNALQESPGGLTNNRAELSVTVLSAPIEATETQILDFARAKAAGAQTRLNYHTIDRQVTETIPPWVRVSVSGRRVAYTALPSAALQFNATPPYPDSSAVFQMMTAREATIASPEAFLGFELKNGWTVDLVEDARSADLAAIPPGGVLWVKRPRVGDVSPYIRLSFRIGPLLQPEIYVRIRIRGPRGTDPYR